MTDGRTVIASDTEPLLLIKAGAYLRRVRAYLGAADIEGSLRGGHRRTKR